MRVFFSLIGLGFGLGIAGALVYYAVSNPLVLVVLVGLAMLILGLVISGVLVSINNKRWIESLGQILGNNRITTNNKYTLETRPGPYDNPIPGQFQVVNRQSLPAGQPTWDQQLGFPPAATYDYEESAEGPTSIA